MNLGKCYVFLFSAILCVGLLAGCGGETNSAAVVSKADSAAVKTASAESTAETSDVSSKSEETEKPKKTEAPVKTEAPKETEAPEEITAENLLNNYFEAGYDGLLEMRPISFQMDQNIIISAKFNGNNVSTTDIRSYQYKCDGRNWTFTETSTIGQNGEETVTEDTQYCILDDTNFSWLYTYDKDTASWGKSSGFDSPCISEGLIPVVDPSEYEFTLEETKNQYIVTGEPDYSELLWDANYAFRKYLDSLDSEMFTAFDEGTALVEFYFNKETLLPEAVTVDLTAAMNTNIYDFLVYEMNRQLEEEDKDTSFDLEVEVPSFVLKLTDISYDDVEILLPDEAKDAPWTDEPVMNEYDLLYPMADSFTFKDEYKTVSFNGKKYTIEEETLADFLKRSGLELDEDSQGKTVESKAQDTAMFFLDEDYTDMVTVEVSNRSGKTLPITECTIIGFDFWDSGEEPIDFSIAGFGPGSTFEDIIAVLGNPTHGYESDYISSYSWDSDDWYTINFVADRGEKAIHSAHIYVFE